MGVFTIVRMSIVKTLLGAQITSAVQRMLGAGQLMSILLS